MVVHPFEITDIREVTTGQTTLKRAVVLITLESDRFQLDFYHERQGKSRGQSGFTENEEFLRFIRSIPHDDIIVILLSWLNTHLIHGYKYPTPFPINEEAQKWRISDEHESAANRARLDFLREHGLEK